MLIVALAACGSNSTKTPTSGGGQASTNTSTASTATSASTSPTSAATATAATGSPTSQSGSTPSGSPTAGTTTLNLYFIRDGKVGVAHRTVAKTQQVGATAMQELLKGPNSAEQSAGLSTSIPDGTQYIGLSIDNKVATVNLSGDFKSGGDSQSESLSLAQVVYTLTQFSTVDMVSFKIDGTPVTSIGGTSLSQPVGRADFEDVTPAILVETPAVGDTIKTPVRLTGTANTFEAAFVIDILDANGNLLQEQHATATSGTGTRGTFDVTVPFKVDAQQDGKVVVFELSAKDGSKTNVVEIPVTLAP
jgi:germination protein M